VDLSLIPNGYRDCIANAQKQIVVCIPFGIQGGLAYLR